MLDCEMLSSFDTHQVLLAGLAWSAALGSMVLHLPDFA